MTDVVLSSGFLAFSRHVGFLSALEDAGEAVRGVCGTSSGALVGALWAAGVPASEIGILLSERAPIRQVGLSRQPWRGLFSLDRMLARLADYLPETFEDLPRPLAVGVMGPDRRAVLLDAGPLIPAVAASCAVPWLFAPITVGGTVFRDGGVVDRTGLGAWRARHPAQPVLLHLVERSHGANDPPPPADVRVVRTPRSGAALWDLGDFDAQVEEAYTLTRAVLSGGPGGGAR
jgi:predicted acylesterase/phospholipase RssA